MFLLGKYEEISVFDTGTIFAYIIIKNTMIKNLDEKISKEFLKSKGFGRLGCVLESGEPYVIPVNYLFEDDAIYIHSLPGQKISAMKTNPKVCFQTDELSENEFEWQSVIAFGEFEEIIEKNKKIKILVEFYNKFPYFTPVEARYEEEDFDEEIIVFRINVKRITGVAESY